MREILVSVILGLLGLGGAGALSIALASLLWRRGAPSFAHPRAEILALIPAHQERETIADTVRSLREAAQEAGRELRIVVGADACSDGTARAAEEAGAEVRNYSYRSKWLTLKELARLADGAQWVVFVDAGALWPRELLRSLEPALRDPGLAGIAPAYLPGKASFLERVLWRAESAWKSWENHGGGPMSVHGATVFYRAEALAQAYACLERFAYEGWLNDDVALPLAARIRFPGAGFLYWCPADPGQRVSDAGLREHGSQIGRRRRMLVGNFQWMLALWPLAWRESPAAALLGVRRVVRVLWAWWCLALLYAGCLSLVQARAQALPFAASSAAAIAAILLIFGKRGLVEAALISLAAPLFLPLAWRRRGHGWS